MPAALKIHRDSDDETPPTRPQSASPSAIFTSPEWITKLVTLLSQLEDRRARIPDKIRGNAKAILDAIDDMIAACEAISSGVNFPAELNAVQAEALAKAGAFLMATAEARQAAPTGVLKSLWSAMTNKDATVPAQVRACLLAAFEAMSAYFTLFTRAFPTSATARNWVEAASAFLGEFNTLIRDLPD